MKTLTTEELAGWIDSGRALRLVDVLKPDHYALVHLPGAESIPRAELEGRAPRELSRDETIVVYCSSFDCRESPRAAELLERLGYEDVYDFEGGIADWRRRGLPVVRAERDSRAA